MRLSQWREKYNRYINKSSIKQKFSFVTFGTFSILLLLNCAFMEIKDLANIRTATIEGLEAVATNISFRSGSALNLDDRAVVEENLRVSKGLDYIDQICIYDTNGNVYSRLAKRASALVFCPVYSDVNQSVLGWFKVKISAPIQFENKTVGLVFIEADLGHLYWGQLNVLYCLLGILAGASVFTYLLSLYLNKNIILPIGRLVQTLKKISIDKNYELRAQKSNNDEVGLLIDTFNNMLATVDRQNKALVEARNRYLLLFDDNPSMIFNIDEEGGIISVNKFGARQLSQTANRLHGFSVFDFVHPDDRNEMRHILNMCAAELDKVHKLELRLICVDKKVIWVRGAIRSTRQTNGKVNILLVCEDITETRKLNEKISHQARHDELTGLLNRSEFDRQIQQALLSAHNNRTEYALCYLDLDQFKVVNDTCGHIAGDELLRQLGALLKKQIRQDDLLARLGGDEFGILMRGCLLSQAYNACEKIRNAVQNFQFAWEDRLFRVGVSIGIASINSISGNSIESLKEADAACYAAKEKGRNRVHVFRPNDQELASRQGEMQWVEKIQQGIINNRFCLYGQPIVPIDGREEGLHFETLIRYQDAEGHIIPPGAFLTAAERYNLASELDKWVISTLFEWMAKRPGFIENLAMCSVNLSGLSLSDETMLDFISEQFNKWRIPTHCICFEITETAAIASLSNATHFIRTLKQQGCFFSLDDFGSGLSSFAYLKNLPVDYLKIDGLFVKDIVDDKVDLAMVRSINEVGHVMDKKTIAEFVENDEILDILKQLGVDYAQGYGIGKPVPLAQL
ncbi:EAL domain-containing protein [Methylicorpusculum sp.]|uniref:EAL domain-containing protein n=3 Tax=Methylicorpusculum sp. TaxID=2713644 RepID=UPI0027257D0D|nr:EAL domain-containing protein [Methylicorpusculum sp.]MDO8845146.1 EAL domain-containing protein [Methylicorpusculum sp.]